MVLQQNCGPKTIFPIDHYKRDSVFCIKPQPLRILYYDGLAVVDQLLETGQYNLLPVTQVFVLALNYR